MVETSGQNTVLGEMADQLAKRLDKGVPTDSQDEMDHGVQPMDPNDLSYKKE